MEPTNFDIQYAAMRRSIIEQAFAHLNERQREAVLQTEGPLLVLAGAGSGKTTVLINRIVNILRFGRGASDEYAPENANEDDLLFLAQYMSEPQEENRSRAERLCAVEPAKPWEVIAITFTNKAAKELKERLTRALGETDANEVWAYTFHTACLRILRRYGDRLGYEKAFTIYDEDDKKRMILPILRAMNLDEKVYDPRMVMGVISRAKDELLTPKKFAAQTGADFMRQKIGEVYQQYEREMKRACALDFDDIIVKTVLLLQQNEDILDYYQKKFRYVLVDEYQDTNHAQYVLSSLLAGGYQNICVVGDDDQSIYKFRGATISNILEFEQQFKHATTIRLEQNYRSTGNILSAANELIRNNAKRKGKELWTDQNGGSKIHLHRSDSQEGEAAYIADTILDGVQNGRRWSDYAILYRNNVLSNNIEAAFRRNAVPYRIYKGRDFFSRAEIKDVFAYLWVIENPADTLRLKRIINTPARKIGDRSVEVAEELAAREGKILYEIVTHAGDYPELARAAAPMMKFGEMMENLRQQREYLSLGELYDEMLDRSGYVLALTQKGDMDSQSRYENIQELKSNIVEYEGNSETPTLGGFLEDMALFTDADHTAENDDAVLMMTMHSAKGLEFPVVFLAGMEDGLFPGFRAQEREEDMEEERRLCYVAVTRAREDLYLTCAERRLIYGRTQYAHPSRFIDEMPQELLDSNVSATSMAARAAETVQRDRTDFTGARRSSLHVGSGFGSRPSVAPSLTSKPAPAADFPTGCRLRHKVFGEGLVVSSRAMGGDQLLEIAFDEKGTKRLMANSAAKMMERLN